MSKGNYKKKRNSSKSTKKPKAKIQNANSMNVKEKEVDNYKGFLLALNKIIKTILKIPLLGRLILCSIRIIKKVLLILLKPLAKIFIRLGNNTNKINRIGVVLYVSAMIVGILCVNKYLILLGSIFSFLFGFFTFSSIQKRINKTFYNLTGTSIYNKEFVVFISLGLSLVLFLAIRLFEEPVEVSYECLTIANLGNLFMGISLVLIVFDSIFIKNDS